MHSSGRGGKDNKGRERAECYMVASDAATISDVLDGGGAG